MPPGSRGREFYTQSMRRSTESVKILSRPTALGDGSLLPGLFAAGDCDNKHSHQVVSAAAEGAMAAQAANHVLYPPLQRL